MSFAIRAFTDGRKFCDGWTVEALAHSIAPADVRQVVRSWASIWSNVAPTSSSRRASGARRPVSTPASAACCGRYGRTCCSSGMRAFHSVALLAAVRARRAHARRRLPSHVQPRLRRALPDGSYLATLRSPEHGPAGLLVRLITYTITDPTLPGYGETYRLVTTLLNPRVAPAHALALPYHERWEVELVIDEIATHQRLTHRTLRSQTPAGGMQELYGLLLAHYAVRVAMAQAAQRAGLDPDWLSFTQAVQWVQEAIIDFQAVSPAQWPRLYERRLTDLARPPRRGAAGG
jgi:hypothetical protein